MPKKYTIGFGFPPRRIQPLLRTQIAGTFGNYFNSENAKIMGLIPDTPTEIISLIGNTVLAGAKTALRSKTIKDLAEKLSKEIKYVELMMKEGFERGFTSSILLPYGRFDQMSFD